jgi:general secretion pathway protein A
VLIIDEAQNLSADVLEQLRLLTNLETSERKLLQIVLIGQPELRDMLARPELEQLAQRVIARFHLGRAERGRDHPVHPTGWPWPGTPAQLPFDAAALQAHPPPVARRAAAHQPAVPAARCWAPGPPGNTR